MTELQNRLRQILAASGPLYPWEVYARLWPGRELSGPEGPSRGGPDTRSVVVHRMMGRSGFRDLFEQCRLHLHDPCGPGVSRYRNRSGVK